MIVRSDAPILRKQQTEARNPVLSLRNPKFESISLQRRVFANLTRSIRSPKILPSELRAAASVARRRAPMASSLGSSTDRQAPSDAQAEGLGEEHLLTYS